METTVIFLFVVVSALAALIVLLAFRRKSAAPVDAAAADYAEGLSLLLAGEREQALKKFKDTVGKESRNVDAYIRIGDILRTLGRVDRAINVHKYLTVRQGLTPKQHSSILQSLACDYQAAERYDQALEVLKKVLEADKQAAWALEMQLELYEALSDWPRAFQVCKKLQSKNGELKNRRLALYKVREGLTFSNKSHTEKEAQSCFKEAIKIDPAGPAGYIALADSHKRQDHTDDALKVLKQFVEKVPEQSFFAFGRLKELLYEGGVYGEIQNLYLEIIQSQPDNLMARLALVENYEKKGELQRAIDESLSILERDPDNKSAKKYLVKLHHKLGNSEEALKIALDLIDESFQEKEGTRFDLTELLGEKKKEDELG